MIAFGLVVMFVSVGVAVFATLVMD